MMTKASDDSELPGFTLSAKDTENGTVAVWFTHNKTSFMEAILLQED